MTLSTAVDRTQTVGDGATTLFPYLFKIWDKDDIEVIRANLVAPLAKDTLAEGSDYTVADVGAATGGTIQLIGAQASSPPTSDESLTILRKMPYTQEVAVTNQGGFKGNTHETAWDKMVALIQQLRGITDRCLQVDETSTTDPADITYESFAGDAPLDTDNFDGHLSAADDTVQKAFETLDEVDLSPYAPLASPTFTGVPLAPTAAPDTDTTQLATTAYVDAAVAAAGGPLLIDSVAIATAEQYMTLGDYDVPIPAGYSTLLLRIDSVSPTVNADDMYMLVGGLGDECIGLGAVVGRGLAVAAENGQL